MLTHSCRRWPATLCYTAQVREDDRVLLEIDQQDLWAKDVLYHPSCYANYVSQRALQQKLKKDVSAEDAAGNAHSRAFSSLSQHIRETIIDCPETVTNTNDLSRRYVDFLRDEGMDVSCYRNYILKA